MPIGKPFNEVYDVETVQPKPEWQKTYEEVVMTDIEKELALQL
jgi:hypothetical protein